MNISDTLLVKMIEKDMLIRGISEQNYVITEDRVLENPTQIGVESNQAVYVCSFLTTTPNGFAIRVISGTSGTIYTPQTTKANHVGSFESSVITPHFGTVAIQNNQSTPFYIRYVRVTFNAALP